MGSQWWSNPLRLFSPLPDKRLDQHGIPDLKRKGKEVIKEKESRNADCSVKAEPWARGGKAPVSSPGLFAPRHLLH